MEIPIGYLAKGNAIGAVEENQHVIDVSCRDRACRQCQCQRQQHGKTPDSGRARLGPNQKPVHCALAGRW
jgi:hypothetical protein